MSMIKTYRWPLNKVLSVNKVLLGPCRSHSVRLFWCPPQSLSNLRGFSLAFLSSPSFRVYVKGGVNSDIVVVWKKSLLCFFLSKKSVNWSTSQLGSKKNPWRLRLWNKEPGRINQFLSLQRFSAPKVLGRDENVFIIDIYRDKKPKPAFQTLEQPISNRCNSMTLSCFVPSKSCFCMLWACLRKGRNGAIVNTNA